MLNRFKRGALAAVLAVGAMTIATSAQAHDRYYDRRGDDAALAIGAGIIGLAIGAAIASDRDDRYYYHDRGYYRPYPRYYYRSYPRGYYYDRYPRRDYRFYREYRHRDEPRRYWRY